MLKKGAIEEYYPTPRVVEALKQEYDIEITEEEKKKLEAPFETKEILKKVSMHKPLAKETKVGEALEKLDIVHNGIVPLNFEHSISTDQNKLKRIELCLTAP